MNLSKLFIYVLSFFLLVGGVLSYSNSSMIPAQSSETLFEWNVPMSALWDFSFDLDLVYDDNITDIFHNFRENSTILLNNSCENCTSINGSGEILNRSLEKGETYTYVYNWSRLGIKGFDQWKKISHYNGDENYTETSGWTFNSTSGEISTNVNSVGFMGLVSPENYSNYDFEVTFRSTGTDDDTISFILAYYENETGAYTLTANRATGGIPNDNSNTISDYRWWIEYEIDDFRPDPVNVLYNGSEHISVVGGNWVDYENGSKVKATRNGSIITVITTELNNETYKPETEFTINLSADSRLQKFEGSRPIGYGALSQTGTVFSGVAVENPIANVSFDLMFSCSEEGCLCTEDSACNSGFCSQGFNSTQSYCATSSLSCSQPYNSSVSIGHVKGDLICSQNSSTLSCSEQNVCKTVGDVVCTPDYSWENVSVDEVGCEDSDLDGIYDFEDKLNGGSQEVINSGIDDLKINVSGNLSATTADNVQNVSLIADSFSVVSFAHNFSNSSLDLSKIKLIKSSRGLITNFSDQLQEGRKKTIVVEDNDFVSLCVKDAHISSFDQITSSCTGPSEINFNSCLGNSTGVKINNITCVDLGSKIKVGNLSFSAVRGEIEEDDSDSSNRGGGSSSFRSYTQCADGIDNDGDGEIDMNDSGCDSLNDDDESDEPIVESEKNESGNESNVTDTSKDDLNNQSNDTVDFLQHNSSTAGNVEETTSSINVSQEHLDLNKVDDEGIRPYIISTLFFLVLLVLFLFLIFYRKKDNHK